MRYKMVKKNLVVPTFVGILLAAMLTSCMTVSKNPIIWDDALPESDVATLYWGTYGGNVHPVVYNGVNVDWKTPQFSWSVFKIPAGDATFELAGSLTWAGSYNYRYIGISFTHSFEGGKEYTVLFDGGHISIYGEEPGGTVPPEENLIQKITPKWN
ncbi:hypothetical protein FACS189476_10550 [Spirochaetia bacterium]|nr:hypothetical protein FACS189476_10550 [Spirochaetia bacterium]